jgi:sulfate permease, SulP family
MAGLTVGVVALPLAIAFAIASGVKPEQGLYTAVVAGFIISAFGGSRTQIGGPTGAFIVIVYGIVQVHGYDGLVLATLMAGVLMVVMGLSGLGSVIKFVPYPMVVGFTSGIALIIASSQMRDLGGLQMDAVPAEFIDKWIDYGQHLSTFNPQALLVAALAVAIIVLWPRITHRLPGSLIAIIATTALVHLLNFDVETIGSRFGSVPTGLPSPQFPDISWQRLRELSSPALAIALLASIESLLSAVVADGMTGRRHRSDMELVAQGLANIASPILGGIPATGAIARTATNIRNGGRTPVAGIVHALTLLLIMLFFGHWATLIPMATLAAVLLVVSYNMGEWHLFYKMLRGPHSDVLVMGVTFLLTVFIDLVIAIEVGFILAALLFMRRMAQVTQVNQLTHVTGAAPEDEELIQLADRVPKGVEIFEVYGPFFFGAANSFRDTLRDIEKKRSYSFCTCVMFSPSTPPRCRP